MTTPTSPPTAIVAPKVGRGTDSALAALDLLSGRRLVILTGAGISTDSGIPDYRGPGKPARTPMTYGEFVSGATAQQRYWARSYLGWGVMGDAQPNDGHRAVAAVDPTLLITQNVDGLHERAGSRRLVALHGRISEVVCLDCGRISTRRRLQARLDADNQDWAAWARRRELLARPDGDIEFDDVRGFTVSPCEDCGGPLKPNVVFFGENVPRDRVQRCYDGVEELADADGALLVAGSSLTVMSGLRFVRRAAGMDVPIVIVNRGITRGDDLATHRVHAGCSEFLASLAALR